MPLDYDPTDKASVRDAVANLGNQLWKAASLTDPVPMATAIEFDDLRGMAMHLCSEISHDRWPPQVPITNDGNTVVAACSFGQLARMAHKVAELMGARVYQA